MVNRKMRQLNLHNEVAVIKCILLQDCHVHDK